VTARPFCAICFLPLLIGAVLVMAVIPIVQSYVLWKREQNDRP